MAPAALSYGAAEPRDKVSPSRPPLVTVRPEHSLDNQGVEGQPFRVGDVVSVAGGQQPGVRARVLEARARRLVLELEAADVPAQPLRRAAPRYATEFSCAVVLPEGGRLPARAVDISATGIALLLTRARREGWFWVELGNVAKARVRAEVVAVEESLLGFVHHCRFVFDTVEGERAVAAFVEACRDRFTASQRSVALRRLGPLRPKG